MLGSLCDLTIVALCAGSALCAASYVRDRRALRAFVNQLTRNSLQEKDAVLAIAQFIFSHVVRGKDPVFLLPALAPLGGTPLAILREGGCCSGVHRLFIVCLDVIGIRAAQITFYHDSNKWWHCAVQVMLNDQPIIFDVDYGVIYEGPHGDAIGIMDLWSGVKPTFRVFADGLQASSSGDEYRDCAPGYPGSLYYQFNYRNTRTINWGKSWIRRIAYALLKTLSHGRINGIMVAPMFEWPQLVMAFGMSLLALAMLTARVVGMA